MPSGHECGWLAVRTAVSGGGGRYRGPTRPASRRTLMCSDRRPWASGDRSLTPGGTTVWRASPRSGVGAVGRAQLRGEQGALPGPVAAESPRVQGQATPLRALPEPPRSQLTVSAPAVLCFGGGVTVTLGGMPRWTRRTQRPRHAVDTGSSVEGGTGPSLRVTRGGVPTAPSRARAVGCRGEAPCDRPGAQSRSRAQTAPWDSTRLRTSGS